MKRLDEDNTTLEKLQLVPAAVINVGLDSGATGTLDLKPELTAHIEELHTETLPVAQVGDPSAQPPPSGVMHPSPTQPPVRTDYIPVSDGSSSSSSNAPAKKTPKWLKL